MLLDEFPQEIILSYDNRGNE